MREITRQQTQFQELFRSNELLEQRVSERTAMLATAMHQLSVILGHAPIGIAEVIDRKLVWINSRAAELFLYSKEELEGGTTRILYPSDEAYEQHGNEAYPLLALGERYETVQEMVRKDKSRIWTRYIGKDLAPPDLSKGVLWLMEEITAQKISEEKLRESEEKYRSLVESISDLIWESDQQGRFTYLSPKVQDMLGYTPEELLGHSPVDSILGEKNPQELEGFNCNMVARQSFRRAELCHRHRDGREIIVETSGDPLLTPEGEFLGYRGATRDITESKKSQEALQETEHLSRVAMDTLTANICVIDAAGTILSVNRKWEEFAVDNSANPKNCGVGSDYLAVCAAAQGNDGEIARLFAQGLRAVIAGELTIHEQEYSCHSPTEQRWFCGRAIRFTESDPVRVVVTHENITELKHTERELKESRTLLKAIIEETTDAIYVKDLAGRYLLFNSAAARYVGKRSEEVLGQDDTSIFPAEEVRKIIARDRQVISEKRTVMHEITVTTASGGATVFHSNKGPLLDDKGNVFGIFGINRDITAFKETEAHLQEVNHRLSIACRQAESANQAKSEFLANMSHEIRTPMNAIIGLGHLALQTDLTHRQRDYLEKINLSAEGLLRLLNNLLDFSKIEAGKLEMEESTFPLLPLMEQSLSLAGVTASAKGLQLRLGYDSKIPEYLVGDPLRLEQILLNLLGNAVKFTSSGSVLLNVTPAMEEGGRIVLEFSVYDSGIGMTKEQMDGIFQPFTQADGSITRRYGGTGLGLNICKRLVELMGGEIRVESEAGRGSCFTFTVRLMQGSTPEVTAGNELQGPMVAALAGGRVLVVDDQPLNRQVLQELLEQVGVSVSVAAHGREALDIMVRTEGGFDLLLMDLQMPEMDGYEATRLIRERWSSGRLPIIAMTAHAGNEERDRSLQAGMNDHLTKPVSPLQLYTCLIGWIGNDVGQKISHMNDPPSESPEPLPDSLPGLDIYAGLTRLGGNSELYRKLALEFCRTIPERIAELRVDLNDGELIQAGRKAHALKGVASTIGATGMADLSGQLEQACVRNSVADAVELFSRVAEYETELSVSAALLTGAVPAREERDFPDAIRELLRELTSLTPEHNLAALKVSRQLSDLLAETELAEQARTLADSFARMEFTTAALLLAEFTGEGFD